MILYHAVSGNEINTAKLLLSSGAEPNIANAEGWYPIHHAVENNRYDLVKLLLENGADPNSKRGELTLIGMSKNENITKLIQQYIKAPK